MLEGPAEIDLTALGSTSLTVIILGLLHPFFPLMLLKPSGKSVAFFLAHSMRTTDSAGGFQGAYDFQYVCHCTDCHSLTSSQRDRRTLLTTLRVRTKHEGCMYTVIMSEC